MDFAKLLATVKDNLDLHEEEIDEEALKKEKQQEIYTENLTKSYNENLEKIEYSETAINILNKVERDNMNKLYSNINPMQNIRNAKGEITQIRELNVSTITMFFPLDCEVINLSMISKHVCSRCNIIGCNGNICCPFNENDIKKKGGGRGKKPKNNKKEAEKFACTIQVPGSNTRIPLKKLKQFDNQYSYYVHFENHNDVIPYFNELKNTKERDKILKPRIIKIFQNGALTVLGVKTLEQGFAIAKKVIRELNAIMVKEPDLIKNVKSTDATEQSVEKKAIKLYRNKADGSIVYDTHLINSTYYIDFKINRPKLHEIIVNKYGITKNQCDYRPNAYPAVPIKFYWNSDNRYNGKFGKCTCNRTCNGKGTGQGNGQCKAITITVFESGSISFMGAKHKEQLADCYHFINSILNMEYENVFKERCKPVVKKTPKKKYTKRIKINMNQISNLGVWKKLIAI